MHSVCELHGFRRAAKAAGLSDEAIEALVVHLADNPAAGDEIVGTGGCRKLRWAVQGRGKRGGVRTITFFSGETLPVFLITVFAKGERADLTQGERNALRSRTKVLVDEYAKKTRKVGR